MIPTTEMLVWLVRSHGLHTALAFRFFALPLDSKVLLNFWPSLPHEIYLFEIDQHLNPSNYENFIARKWT